MDKYEEMLLEALRLAQEAELKGPFLPSHEQVVARAEAYYELLTSRTARVPSDRRRGSAD